MVAVDIDRNVGTTGVDFAEAAPGDAAGLENREGVLKASLEGV